MKKRLFTSILSVLLLMVISIFGFAGCFNPVETEKTIKLNETAKELVVGESFTLTATTTPADAEVVWSTSDETIVTVENGTVTAISVGAATVTAKNDTVTAICEITVKAAPVVETKEYTVVFKNGDAELKSVKVAEGAAVVYSGLIPSKAATEQYEYTFSGWSETEGGETVDLASVTLTENKTFYAVFTENVRNYTVSWNIDGVTTEDTVAYGTAPEYKGATPTKPTVGNTSYTFIGWASTLSGAVLETLPIVTGNTTYYAVFEEVTAQTKFTVTWKNGETELEKDVNVEYEATPTYDGATPVKESTTESDFVFVGWAASIGGAKLEPMPEVTANATYYAVFEPTARKYTITWMIEGVEKTSECAYGTVPVYTETPVKEDSETCSFKFVGWALTEDGAVEETLPTVSGEATYYAVFEVDQIFELPKFIGGKIEYSANSQEIFLPDGLLCEGVTIVKAVLKTTALDKVTVYENGTWAHELITLTEEELKGNFIGARSLEVELSDGAKYSVDMNVYAGIIDEFADFPKFFNTTAVPSETKPEEHPAVAPNVYGYYIVTKDLGAYTFDKDENTFVYEDELAFEQTEATDYEKTNGFNGVLDGQGHTLKFKLTKGALVGLVLGNAVIKNLGVLYADETTTQYGAFGYITNGSPEIRNCYIERTNNKYEAWSVFGIMSRPNTKLILHNTVVYGYNVSNNCAKNSNMWINETSTNAYIIHARKNAMEWVNVQNFTKVFTDAIENGSREVLLSEIEDVSKFDDNYWYKENGKLIWKGFALETVTWVKGEETVTETVTKDGWIMYTQTLPENTTSNTETVEYYWSTTEDGEAVKFSDRFQVKESVTYYMVEKREIRLYTVTWNIGGVTTEDTVAYGTVPEYKGATPTKPTVGNTSYTFIGWALTEDGAVEETLPTVSGEATYYAVFEEVTAQSKFTVTWKNGETVLEKDVDVEYEAIPTYDGATPVKESTTEGEFVFVGWAASADGAKLDPLPAVTADTTYYAVFEVRKYTITWIIEGVEKTSECAYGTVPAYTETPVKEDSEICSFKFVGWALTEDGAVEETLPTVSGEATYYAVFEVDQIFESPKFVGGRIEYSANSQEIFLPDGLLGEGVTIVKAVLKKTALDRVTVYENGTWAHELITLTEEELKGNVIGARFLEVELSDGAKYSVDMNVYAGIINELSDFPAFFNNEAVDNTNTKNASDYPKVAPSVYGYYIVTKDLGTGVEELSFTQCEISNFTATCGFNGVLDGQGHTLRFKLMSGGLVGQILGNATIKNLGVIYEDVTSTYYGVFGYMTNGTPVIENCYIERTNNHYKAWSVFGIMSRPNARLVLKNTVVYGYNISNNCAMNGNMWISASSENAYIIHARKNAMDWVNVQGFTKVFTDAIENGSREVLLSEIEDVSKFDDNYWYKENGKLIWKGFALETVTWVKGEETVTETVTKDGWIMYTQTLPENTTSNTETVEYYWSTTEDGSAVKFSDRFQVKESVTYYMVEKREICYYTVTWVIDGETTTTDYEYGAQAERDEPIKTEDEYYTYEFKGWSLTEGGELIELPTVTGEATYYAVFEATAKVSFVTVSEAILYSTADDQLFLPTELTLTLDESVTVESRDGAISYYKNGAWAKNFDLTDEQMKANAIGETEIAIRKGTEIYLAKVKSYAGIIDEFADFPKFFNTTAVPSETKPEEYPAVAPNVYGYYIVTKDLGAYTFDKEKNTFVYEDELAFEQTEATDYQKTNGFNGVLDGQGHTLKFKLTKGALVGLVLGNAVIKNLGVLYEDATTTYYGVFGYMTNGNPEIRNCYIERTNNHYQAYSVFGIMARPNTKLIMHNTVVYGYNTSNNSAKYGNMWINETSTNAYIIHARKNATDWVNVQGFTKVFTDAIENGSREVLLSEIEDVSKFDDNYWYKENGKLIWKGFALETVTWVKGEETVTETVTKDGWIMYTQTLPENTTSNTETVEYYWSTTEDGEAVKFSDRFQVKESVTYYMVEKREICYYTVTWVIDGETTTTDYEYGAQVERDEPIKTEDEYYTYEFKGWSLTEGGELIELPTVTGEATYYAVFEATAKFSFITVNEAILYSTADDQLFLPTELTLTLDESVTVESRDGAISYYKNGVWAKNFDLTDEQMKANAIGETEIAIKKGTEIYLAKVKSYAGVIDELSDFPAFFNNDPSATHARTYGYYIVTKDLGTGAEELSLTQSATTDYKADCGFNGVLDGAGHTLKFKLMSGGLVGLFVGNGTIKNLSVIYADETSTQYGVFGYMTSGNPVIDNCYIERTNNKYQKWSVFGIMSRPNAKLVLKNTVVYGYNISNECAMNSNMWISASSTNAYLIHARANATGWVNVQNFTKVFNDGVENGAREVALSEIADASTFNECWSKENGKLTWKGATDTVFSSVVKVNA